MINVDCVLEGTYYEAAWPHSGSAWSPVEILLTTLQLGGRIFFLPITY